MTDHEPYGQMFPWPPPRPKPQAASESDLIREVTELRNIVAAMMIKYASGRAVLNPDVLGAVDSSLLHIDTSMPGMVVVRYGSPPVL